jgi:hypothetical protein
MLKEGSEARNYQRNGVKSLHQLLDSIRGAPVNYFNCKTTGGAQSEEHQ